MKKKLFLTFGVSFFLLFSTTLQAGNISVTPIKIIFEPQKSIATLHLKNHDSTPTTVQLTLYRWEQSNTKDILSPTQEVLVTPARVILNPQEKQFIRLGLQDIKTSDHEIAYRLLIRELPNNDDTHTMQQLNIVLQLSLPIFILPQESVMHYSWKILKKTKDAVVISIKNDGNVHLLLNTLQLFNQGIAQSKPQSIFTYVLPGQSHLFNIPLIKPQDLNCNPCKIMINNK